MEMKIICVKTVNKINQTEYNTAVWRLHAYRHIFTTNPMLRYNQSQCRVSCSTTTRGRPNFGFGFGAETARSAVSASVSVTVAKPRQSFGFGRNLTSGDRNRAASQANSCSVQRARCTLTGAAVWKGKMPRNCYFLLTAFVFSTSIINSQATSEWVCSFLTAHQHKKAI